MDDEKLSTAVHSAVGAITGYLSNFTGKPLHAAGIAIVVLFVTGNIMQNFVDSDEGFKWWAGNGVAPFLLLWVIFSIFFYNL